MSLAGLPDETCFNVCDGTITTTVNGGVAPFNYVLTPGGIANATGLYTNLCPATYTVTVTDANNVVVSATAIVNAATQIVWTTPVVVNPTCVPNNNGSIVIGATGGAGGIIYTISPAAVQAPLGTFTGLTAQTYTITATDLNNCSVQTTVQLISPNSPTVSITNITNVLCNGQCNGTAQANAVGGVAPLTYSINAGTMIQTQGLLLRFVWVAIRLP